VLYGRGSTHRTAGCGPACPVVWEGRGREASPYPDSVDYFNFISKPRGRIAEKGMVR